jgi:hypothetical protein
MNTRLFIARRNLKSRVASYALCKRQLGTFQKALAFDGMPREALETYRRLRNDTLKSLTYWRHLVLKSMQEVCALADLEYHPPVKRKAQWNGSSAYRVGDLHPNFPAPPPHTQGLVV